MDYLILYKILESLSAEIYSLSTKIVAKMSHGVSDTSTTTVFLNSPKNSTQSPGVPASSKVSPTAKFVEAPNDDMKLYPSVRDSLKIMNLTRFMEPSTP